MLDEVHHDPGVISRGEDSKSPYSMEWRFQLLIRCTVHTICSKTRILSPVTNSKPMIENTIMCMFAKSSTLYQFFEETLVTPKMNFWVWKQSYSKSRLKVGRAGGGVYHDPYSAVPTAAVRQRFLQWTKCVSKLVEPRAKQYHGMHACN